MENFNAPFRFDYVGSFLRPAHLKQARADFEAGQITKAELESIENEAITDLIKKQKAAGYPVITDGEFRRSYWHLDFMWGLEGIEHIELDHGYFFHGEETHSRLCPRDRKNQRRTASFCGTFQICQTV